MSQKSILFSVKETSLKQEFGRGATPKPGEPSEWRLGLFGLSPEQKTLAKERGYGACGEDAWKRFANKEEVKTELQFLLTQGFNLEFLD